MNKNKRKAAERETKKLMKDGDKHLYFLDPGMPLGDDHEATADRVHPTDLGHERILRVIRPKIGKILGALLN